MGVRIVHGSCVALDGRAALLVGPSGCGKSTLALRLMSHGAGLVSDDRTCLATRPRGVLAWAPRPILGLIEARGVGVLRAVPERPAILVLIVDLSRHEPQRLPPHRSRALMGHAVPLICGRQMTHLDAAVLQWLRVGRVPT